MPLLPRSFHPYLDCHVLNITIVLLNLDWGYVWGTLWFILLILQHHLNHSATAIPLQVYLHIRTTEYFENYNNKKIIIAWYLSACDFNNSYNRQFRNNWEIYTSETCIKVYSRRSKEKICLTKKLFLFYDKSMTHVLFLTKYCKMSEIKRQSFCLENARIRKRIKSVIEIYFILVNSCYERRLINVLKFNFYDDIIWLMRGRYK